MHLHNKKGGTALAINVVLVSLFLAASLLIACDENDSDLDDDSGTAEDVCVYGQDHTCNGTPTVSSIQGTCNEDGTCTCTGSWEKNPETGLCQ